MDWELCCSIIGVRQLARKGLHFRSVVVNFESNPRHLEVIRRFLGAWIFNRRYSFYGFASSSAALAFCSILISFRVGIRCNSPWLACKLERIVRAFAAVAPRAITSVELSQISVAPLHNPSSYDSLITQY